MIKSTIECFPSLPFVFMNEHPLHFLTSVSEQRSLQEEIPQEDPAYPKMPTLPCPIPLLVCTPHSPWPAAPQHLLQGCHLEQVTEDLGSHAVSRGTLAKCEIKNFIRLITEVTRGKKNIFSYFCLSLAF